MMFFAVALFASCQNDKRVEKTESATIEEKAENSIAQTSGAVQTVPVPAPGPMDKLLGSFVGEFGTNKITMLITKVGSDSIYGRTIVGGNDRPFKGTITKSGEQYAFSAKEPGDHKDDGTFNFSMSDADPSSLSGSWQPFAKNKPAKQYTLQRKAFVYKTDVGEFPEASQRLLKVGDVENLMKEDLEFMRNEIFARHGYCFSKKHLRQQFEMQDWYVPNTVNIKGFLTEIEKKNIDLIKRYEKYAEEYGDEYGR